MLTQLVKSLVFKQAVVTVTQLSEQRETGRDAGSEEVQITGGTNISVTRNSGNKLTIASTAPAAPTVYWQENSGHIRPTTSNRNVIPNGTSADLGLTGTRWRNGYFNNVYTNDLHLKNERGDWTLIEEEDCLTVRNKQNREAFCYLDDSLPGVKLLRQDFLYHFD